MFKWMLGVSFPPCCNFENLFNVSQRVLSCSLKNYHSETEFAIGGNFNLQRFIDIRH